MKNLMPNTISHILPHIEVRNHRNDTLVCKEMRIFEGTNYWFLKIQYLLQLFTHEVHNVRMDNVRMDNIGMDNIGMNVVKNNAEMETKNYSIVSSKTVYYGYENLFDFCIDKTKKVMILIQKKIKNVKDESFLRYIYHIHPRQYIVHNLDIQFCSVKFGVIKQIQKYHLKKLLNKYFINDITCNIIVYIA